MNPPFATRSWPTRVSALLSALPAEKAQGLGARIVGAPLHPLLSPLLPAMDTLERALREGPPVTACQAAVSLLGAGLGLTPSGDDFLAGLLGTLRHLGGGPTALLDRVTAAVLAAAPDRTTAVSAAILRDVLAAPPPRHLAGFWAALRDGTSSALAPAVRRLFAHGSTSPWDFLYGVAAAGRIEGAFGLSRYKGSRKR